MGGLYKPLTPTPFATAAVMISKIDNCMLDLVAYHEKAVADEKEGRGQKPWTNIIARAGSSLRRSLDLNSHRSECDFAAMQSKHTVLALRHFAKVLPPLRAPVPPDKSRQGHPSISSAPRLSLESCLSGTPLHHPQQFLVTRNPLLHNGSVVRASCESSTSGVRLG